MKTTPTSLLLLALVASAIGEEGADQPKGLRGNAERPFAYTGEDLTRVPTRLGFTYDSGVNHNTGTNTNAYLLTGSVSLLGFQAVAEVPLHQRYNPGAGSTQSGIGDSFVSGSFSLPLNPKLRLALGFDTTINTSTEDELGADETIYSPFLGIGIELDEKSMFISRLSYTDSTDNNFERWELLVRGLHRFNDQLFTSVEVTPGWDSLSDEVLVNARALVGARIDRHHVTSLEFELPIDNDSRDQRGSNLRLSYHFIF